MSHYRAISYPSRYPGEFVVSLSRSLFGVSQRLDDAGREAGADVVRYGKGGPRSVYWLRHPDLIRALLIDENDGTVKSRGARATSILIGDGMLISRAPEHTRRRRLVLPAFHHARLRGYASVMVEQAREEAERWPQGEAFDLVEAMNRLALRIASRTLFGADVSHDRIAGALDDASRAFERMMNPLAPLLLKLPLPTTRRLHAARAAIDGEVYRLIADRRAHPDNQDDLLAMLLEARDADTGEGLTDDEIRDEVVTLLLAGHETTANALSWTWTLLAQNPESEARLHAEVDALQAAPTFDDLPRLPFTRSVFAESLRLRPPAWSFGREAVRDLDLCGVPIAKGTTVALGPLFLHRDPRFWQDAEAFDPDRFSDDRKSNRHKFAYLPFSSGRRGCIGEQFAWTEGVLVLAAIAQTHRLRMTGPIPPPQGSITYRPSGPIRAVAERRS